MIKSTITALSVAVVIGLSGCNNTSEPQGTDTVKKANYSNVLLQEFSGPFQGVPQFDKMNLVDLKPALEMGMAEHLADVDKIANNPASPTFDNTIAELERAGKSLDRVFTYYGIWRNNKSSAEARELQKEIAPKLSVYDSKIIQNSKLFNRVKAVFNSDEYKALTPEQQRITWLTYNSFARNGATLQGNAKLRYAAINQQLASLQTKFSSNVLADEESYVVYLNASQLSGLPKSFVVGAAAAAAERGKVGQYAITNSRSSMDPFLTYSTERSLREQVWKNYYNRGGNGDQYDNNGIIKEILTLRHERVQLLGYENYAQWRLEDRMAKTPENAKALMDQVWPAAVARVKEEVADMQAIADKEEVKITIEPWDYRFYSEKVRKDKYALDSNEVKQYLQLDKLREAMFYVAGRLFNFEFSEVVDGSVPVYHDDVRVWEVKDKASGKHVGLWYLDPFARKGKRSGAWANTFRSYTTMDGETNVLSTNNSNFVKGPEGKATLISWSDAQTYFHEFGHALHFLSADVVYPQSHSGVRDYTEFQSQLLERWLTTDEVINQFLVHHETGKPIPKELVAKIKKSATFNQGFSTTEYMGSAIMDLLYHSTDPTKIDPAKFEKEQLTKLGMPAELVMRHRSTHFGHIFSSEGYAAAYYGYLWAEVLTSDAAEAFADAPGGFYDEALANKLVKHLFSVRNAMDPAQAYRLFRGRDADVSALMRDRGFPVKQSD
ncbi:M3 family metallopeptidase [Pseudoalteromonas aurantia]|uniref:oligopeptidase A n=1 Tax=Pseudoalteromonas aurantia 208 TaxID=1314867 RepID=A0ABR9EHK8_9GAMM|nr:M3 family metallopeptidase [Pseudoalteromonas aurantia]MBE0370217.1 peptidyl-dipeptidase Dcp [Pseudoalteromonas aurantia 208]